MSKGEKPGRQNPNQVTGINLTSNGSTDTVAS